MVLFYAKGVLHFLEGSSNHKTGVTKKILVVWKLCLFQIAVHLETGNGLMTSVHECKIILVPQQKKFQSLNNKQVLHQHANIVLTRNHIKFRTEVLELRFILRPCGMHLLKKKKWGLIMCRMKNHSQEEIFKSDNQLLDMTV